MALLLGPMEGAQLSFRVWRSSLRDDVLAASSSEKKAVDDRLIGSWSASEKLCE